MIHHDEASAECLVFTYKEGLLSAIAHDLQIRVTRLSVDVDPEARSIDARFDARSLRVDHAMHGGAPRPDALSDDDKRKIEQSIAGDVLHAARFPEIRFTSTRITPEGDGYRVEGTLTMQSKARPLVLRTRREGEKQVAEARISQPDFGIKPYSAMLGALKIKPDVTVRFSMPAD